MKKITNLLFALLFLVTVVSCNKENETLVKDVKPIEELKTDTRLFKLIDINLSLTSKVVNKDVAIKLLNKDNLSKEELNQLSLSLGFKNSLDYQNLIFQQANLSNELIADYDLRNFDENYKKNIILESINIRNQKIKLFLEENNCERKRRNCLGVVAATATAAHLTCISADFTVVLGTLCHGAAIAYQILAGDTCNADAEDCQAASVH